MSVCLSVYISSYLCLQVYKIDVLTQMIQRIVCIKSEGGTNTWTHIFFSYGCVVLYGIARDWLPLKRLTGNLTAVHVETRKEALERYLQRLVNR